MSSPFIGEIRMFAGTFAPAGWALCDGQLLPISENETLFNLIGTTYGGDGQSTFAVPNLQSRLPLHQGSGLTIGQSGGVESVTLTTQQIPSHNHVPQCQTAPTQKSPANGLWAATAPATTQIYASSAPAAAMNQKAVGSSGGSQPHDNMMPYLVLNFIISLFGIYPTQ